MAEPPSLKVFFLVDETLYPVDERAATGLGEDLRRGATGDLGDQGYEAAALTLADAIEDVLVGAADGPIELDDEQCDAVFYILDAARKTPRGDVYRLYRAVRGLHG